MSDAISQPDAARRLQPLYRSVATEAGLHSTCSLPRCRRARRCAGCHPFEEIGSTRFKHLPPCIDDDPTLALIVRTMDDRIRAENARRRARGMSDADIARADEENAVAFERDDRPTDPLCRPTPPNRRHRRRPRGGLQP